MSRTKIVTGIIGAFLVALVLGGGIYYWLNHKSNVPKKVAVSNTSNQTSGGGTGSNAGTFSSNFNGGQLNLNSGDTTTSGSSGGTSGGQSNGNFAPTPTGQDASQILNPSTFAQYSKYVNNTSALYIDLLTGTGTTLTAGHKAAVYYKGWLTNGTLFDQSQSVKGQLQPFVFTLGAHQVIPGWEEDLDGMKVGGVRFLIIPPALGYGATGQGPIPGNAVLIFQVQLVAVQ